MEPSLLLGGLVFLKFLDDEVHRIENISMDLVIRIIIQLPAFMLGDSASD